MTDFLVQKYYPPDFDPSNIPRLRLAKTRQYTVRVMTPCNMKCNTCGDYIAKGKKFNARKETVEGEDYLGLHIYRFYIKCPTCMAEITFKTDPKNCDYELEHGATRNFQALRLAEMQAKKEAEDAEEEEKLNPMKMLENRTEASRREMQELEDLEELKELSARNVDTGFLTDELLSLDPRKREEEIRKKRLEREREEDEEELRRIMQASVAGPSVPTTVQSLEQPSSSGLRRKKWIKLEGIEEEVQVEIPDDDELEDEETVHERSSAVPETEPHTSLPLKTSESLPSASRPPPCISSTNTFKPLSNVESKDDAFKPLSNVESKDDERKDGRKRKLNGSLAGIKVVAKKKEVEQEKKPSGLALLSNLYSDSDSD